MANVYVKKIQWFVYLPLPTKTKLLSSTEQVNQSTIETILVNQYPDPVTWGYPGGLATVNHQAVKLGVEAAKIFCCELGEVIRFERKNALDPSVPGGYEIVQEKFPIGKNGRLELNDQEKLVVQSVGLTAAKGVEMIDEKGRRRFNYDVVGNPLLKIAFSLDQSQTIVFASYLNQVKSMLRQLSWVDDALLDQLTFELTAVIDTKQVIHVEMTQLQTVADLQLALAFLQTKTQLISEQNRPLQVWKLIFDSVNQKYSLEMIKNTPSEYLLLFDRDIPDIYLKNE